MFIHELDEQIAHAAIAASFAASAERHEGNVARASYERAIPGKVITGSCMRSADGTESGDRKIRNGEGIAGQPGAVFERMIEHRREPREVLLAPRDKRRVRRSEAEHGFGSFLEADHTTRFCIPMSAFRREPTQDIRLLLQARWPKSALRMLVCEVEQIAFDFHSTKPSSSSIGIFRFGFRAAYSGVR